MIEICHWEVQMVYHQQVKLLSIYGDKKFDYIDNYWLQGLTPVQMCSIC